MPEQFYSVTEVSKIMKVSRAAIADRIRRGTLQAQKIGKTYIIQKHEVDRIKSERK